MDDSGGRMKMGYNLTYAPEKVNPTKYSYDVLYKQMETMHVLPPKSVTGPMHLSQQPTITPVPSNQKPTPASTQDKQPTDPFSGSGFYHEPRPITQLPPDLTNTWDNVIRPQNPAFHPVPSSLNSAFRQTMSM
jgi:hypothetical protein